MAKKLIFGTIAFVVILTPIFLKFHEVFNDNVSPRSRYESEIDNLQKQVQTQLNAAKKLNLSGEEIELLVFNASLASIRLSEAKYYVENGDLVDGHNRLVSAKNYLIENKKILQKGNGT